MHSRDFKFTEDDLKYADELNGEGVTFLFNGDLSGDVHIVIGNTTVMVPSWMLLDLVGEFVQSELIEKLEQQTGRETLKFLAGDNDR